MCSKKKRITQFGDLEKYVVNGIDSTAFISNQFVMQSTGDTFTYNPRYCQFLKEKTAGGFIIQTEMMNGSWSLDENKEILELYLSPPGGIEFENIFVHPTVHQWKIIKLTMKEMHLQTYYGGNTYDLYFKDGHD